MIVIYEHKRQAILLLYEAYDALHHLMLSFFFASVRQNMNNSEKPLSLEFSKREHLHNGTTFFHFCLWMKYCYQFFTKDKNRKQYIQVNLCQKHLFLHQLLNPQYEKRLFIESRVQYMKIASLDHDVYTNCFFLDIQNNLCTQHVELAIFMY